MATKDQLIASAQKNLEKGQINKAIRDYRELLSLEPKVDQHKQKLADLLCRVNLKEEALSLYDSLAKGYTERGFFAKGVAVYKQMQRLDPANPEVYLRLAELNRSLGLTGNAMSEYRSLLDHYEKRNMATEAAGVLQKMVELDPENVNLQLRVLQNFLKEKLYIKATETTLKACEVCTKSGDSAKSHKILQSILSHLPDNHEFHAELASKLSAGGLFADAIFVFHSLLKHSPQDALILNELATLYGKVKDAENELLFLDQLLTVQPTAAAAERLVRLCLETGDYGRAQRKLKEYESLLDDENHALLIALYQELESHLPGNQEVRSAIVRLFGGTPPPSAVLQGPSSPPDDVNQAASTEDFSFGAEEFDLHDLLSPLPRSQEPAPLSWPEEQTEEESVDVSIELPLEEVIFDDIDSFVEEVAVEVPDAEVSVAEIDGFAAPPEPTSSVEGRQDGGAQPIIEIDYDFSEFDDVEVENAVEVEVESAVEVEVESAVEVEVESAVEVEVENAVVVEVESAVEVEVENAVEVEVENAVEGESGVVGVDALVPGFAMETIDQTEASPAIDPDRNADTLDNDLAPEEEPLIPGFDIEDVELIEDIEDDAALPVSEIDYDFAGLEGETATVEVASESDQAVMAEQEFELLDEVDDEEEILELEPLEEEDDLNAELAALEELLDAEMEEPAPEQSLRLSVAIDQVASVVSPVDEDFFDLAAEVLDDGALQATEGLANVDENDRFRFDSIFSEFKKGVDAQIDHEDSEAHYDLGIAYKEMGLMDDAIDEFKKSMHSHKRLADSLILIGICYAEKGAFADAEAVFSTAIARPEVEETDKIGTQYELGLVYEIWGRPVDALRTFEAVASSDPSFRNVGEKIEALRLLVSGGSSESAGDTPAASPGNDRISFV